MAGEGKRRSEWNSLLLRDVIAPIYTSLVLKARQVMGAGSHHRALLPPDADMPKPWETLVAASYKNMRNVPVLYSRSGPDGKGRWIPPGQAIVVVGEDDCEGEARGAGGQREGYDNDAARNDKLSEVMVV